MKRHSAVVAVFSLVLIACTSNVASDVLTEVELTTADGRELTIYFPVGIDLTSDGIEATPEPVLDSPDIRLDGGSGSLLVFVDDCDRMNRLDEEVYGNEVFAFCDQPTNTLFFVAGAAEVQQTVHETLRVNN